jgi:hypothetical protein
LKTTQGGIDSNESGNIKDGSSEHTAALLTIQQCKKKIVEHETKIKQMKTIEEKGLDAFD